MGDILLYLGRGPFRTCNFDSFKSIVLAGLYHKFNFFAFPQAPEAFSFYCCLQKGDKAVVSGYESDRQQQLQRPVNTTRLVRLYDGCCCLLEVALADGELRTLESMCDVKPECYDTSGAPRKAHLMHEQVLATSFGSYEAKAFGRIEPGTHKHSA